MLVVAGLWLDDVGVARKQWRKGKKQGGKKEKKRGNGLMDGLIRVGDVIKGSSCIKF